MPEYLLPDRPSVLEKRAAPPTPQQLIFKGLLKHMKPVQAMVFMAFYQQFPERYLPGNDYYFRPSFLASKSQLRIKEPVYHLIVTRLVDGGWLERRKARSGGMEYRIVFERLHDFIEGGKE